MPLHTIASNLRRLWRGGQTSAWQPRPYHQCYAEQTHLLSHKALHYLAIYDLVLAGLLAPGRALLLLEVGVQNGGSLEIWQRYLPPGSQIHGMDIDPRCQNLPLASGITFHLADATNLDTTDQLFANHSLDIILDDGSHRSTDVIISFLNLWRKLKPGGIYLIEDLHTSYFPEYGGGFSQEGSSIETLKWFIDILHADHFYPANGQPPSQNTTLQNFCMLLEQMRSEIASIAFFDSVCAITRLATPKRAAYSLCYNGERALVDPAVTTMFPERRFANKKAELADILVKFGLTHAGE